MIKVSFLGTNGWYDTNTGNTVCTLIEAKDFFIVLDAGNGIYKLDKYIKNSKPVYIFLSHFPLDHIAGFHVLAKFNFRQIVRIFGQPGTKNILNDLMRQPFTLPINKLPFRVLVHELPVSLKQLPFKVRYNELVHSARCFGYRFEIDGKAIAYCTDTGACAGARELAKGADLLISECSLASGTKLDEWPHMNPQDAAGLAKAAGVKKLALTHFDASIYTDIKKRKEAQAAARKIFRNTFAALDGSCVKI